MKDACFVFLGGGLGSLFRYGINVLIPTIHFPWATFAVNIVGSFFIGLFLAMSQSSFSFLSNNHVLFLFLTSGICGGFTTFSAFSKESFMMIHQQQYSLFFAYSLLTIILCLGSTALGFYISK